jgi:hypothetical protein
MNRKQISIEKAIAQIEQKFPNNHCITCYKDFLKQKHLLPHYKFNPFVFNSVLKLTIDVWQSKKRVSRLELINTLLKMKAGNEERVQKASLQIRKNIFEVFEKIKFVPTAQMAEIQRRCNFLFKDIAVEDDGEMWLCFNTHTSPHALNRLLRYPQKSSIITSWAMAHMEDEKYADRRAELVSFVLDEDANYIYAPKYMFNDFYQLNKLDKQVIDSFYLSWEDEKANFLSKKIIGSAFDENIEGGAMSFLGAPELKLKKRFYKMQGNMVRFDECSFITELFIPDFEKSTDDYLDNINQHHGRFMLWSIFYSRIALKQKEELLINFMAPAFFKTMFKMAEKLKSVRLLKALKEVA